MHVVRANGGELDFLALQSGGELLGQKVYAKLADFYEREVAPHIRGPY